MLSLQTSLSFAVHVSAQEALLRFVKEHLGKATHQILCTKLDPITLKASGKQWDDLQKLLKKFKLDDSEMVVDCDAAPTPPSLALVPFCNAAMFDDSDDEGDLDFWHDAAGEATPTPKKSKIQNLDVLLNMICFTQRLPHDLHNTL